MAVAVVVHFIVVDTLVCFGCYYNCTYRCVAVSFDPFKYVRPEVVRGTYAAVLLFPSSCVLFYCLLLLPPPLAVVVLLFQSRTMLCHGFVLLCTAVLLLLPRLVWCVGCVVVF